MVSAPLPPPPPVCRRAQSRCARLATPRERPQRCGLSSGWAGAAGLTEDAGVAEDAAQAHLDSVGLGVAAVEQPAAPRAFHRG